jgi:hypothetical protein
MPVMRSRTGDHLGRRSAAKAEPSPITALRDMLAAAFAADVSAVTPEVCEVLRAGTQVEANPARRDLLRNALVVLARKSGDLAIAVVGEFRAGFDARLVPGESAVAGSSALAADALSPVDDVARRLDLALDQCASRLREQTSAEVSQLTARLCEMLEIESLADADNPVLPRVFARSLLEAIGKLGFDDEAKLAVFKAYGPALLHIAPDVYSHANSLLAELGMQPGFKAQHGTPLKSQPAAPAPVADEKALAATILERLLNGERDRDGKKAKQLATQ